MMLNLVHDVTISLSFFSDIHKIFFTGETNHNVLKILEPSTTHHFENCLF